jgi:hypothetical protein
LRAQHDPATTVAAPPPARTAAEQAIVQVALKRAAGEPPSTAEAGEKSVPAARALTIEEAVAKLQAEADRLLPAGTAKGDDIARRAKQLSSRLRQAAEKLLGHADFVSITDAAGKLLYGNGAFATLVSHFAQKGKQGTRQSWEKLIAAQPIGASRLTASAPETARRAWNLQRTAIADESDGATKAYVNILRSTAKRRLAPDALKRMEPLLDELTLHASFVTYGSPSRRAKSIAALERLSAELETVAGGVAAAKK